MLLVILGAGASHDFAGATGHSSPWKPPLTDELVMDTTACRDTLNLIPERAASGIVNELRKMLAPGITLEDALDTIVADPSARPGCPALAR